MGKGTCVLGTPERSVVNGPTSGKISGQGYDPIMIERSDLPKQNLRGSCSQMDQLRWSALKEIITLISPEFINGYQF